MATSGVQECAEFNYEEAKAALIKKHQAEMNAWQVRYDATLERQRAELLALQNQLAQIQLDQVSPDEKNVKTMLCNLDSTSQSTKDDEDDVIIQSPTIVTKFKRDSRSLTRKDSEDYIILDEELGLKSTPIF